MRTPVASIEGYLGLALNPSTAQIDDKARDFITKAHQSAQHLGRLFQDLLDVSKADDGRLSNNPTVIDIVELTHNVAEGLLPQANAKGLRIDFKPRPDLYDTADKRDDRTVTPVYYTKADADHLREILNNLVENAIKYTLEGGVVIDVKGDDNSIVVSIQDSGIGIPKEDIGHLFQKFYRVDNSDTREIGGTGLGLYLSRKLIEAIGGTIWVESTYKQGSTFFIKLPRLDTIAAKHEIEAVIPEPALEGVLPPAPTTVAAETPINFAPSQPTSPAPAEALQPIAAPMQSSVQPVAVAAPEMIPVAQPQPLQPAPQPIHQYAQSPQPNPAIYQSTVPNQTVLPPSPAPTAQALAIQPMPIQNTSPPAPTPQPPTSNSAPLA
jgi:hypothetical protein